MSLEAATIPLLFRPLNTKLDSKTAGSVAFFDLLENLRARKMTSPEGALELVKRYGTAALTRDIDAPASFYSGPSSISAAVRASVLGDELLLADGTWLHSYSSAVSKWRTRGRLTTSSATVSRIGMVSSGSSTKPDVDVAYAGGVFVYTVWKGAGAFWLYVVSATTGEVMSVGTGAGAASVPLSISGQRPRLAAVGTKILVFYHDGAANLHLQIIDSATPTTIGAATTIATDAHATLKWDVTVDTTNSRALVAYRNNGATLSFRSFNSSGTQIATNSNGAAPDTAIGWLAHSWNDGNAYVAYVNSAGGVIAQTVSASTFGFSGSTTIDATATTARSVTGVFANALPTVVWEIPNATTHLQRTSYRVGSTGSVTDFVRGFGLASKMWRTSAGRYFCAIAYEGAAQRTALIVEFRGAPGDADKAIVGTPLIGDAAGLTQTGGLLPSVASLTSTTFALGLPTMEDAQVFGLARVDLDIAANLPGVNFAGSRYFPGAALMQYDGEQVVEAGFPIFPEAPTLTSTAAAGSLVNGGAYQYAAVYRWRDRNGRLHRSAPSPIASVTLTAGHTSCSVVVPCCRATMKGARTWNLNLEAADLHIVEIELYRTKAGETTLRFCRTMGSAVGSDTTTVSDTTADSALGELLYTDSGEVDNMPPPAPKIVHSWKGRMWAYTPRGLWFTKEIDEALGPEFAAELRMELDEGDGPLTAMIDIDERLMLLRRAAPPQQVTGEGPDRKGDGMYSRPARLSLTVGATNQLGVARTPDGAIVKGPKGFWLLDRAGGEQYIGAMVEDWNALTVTGSVVCETANEVRFTTSDGRTLVWDWFFKGWYTDTGQAAAASVLWNHVFAYVGSDGTVKYEVAGSYADSGVAIASKYRLAWISPFGLHQHGRVRRIRFLGEYRGAHTLKATMARDFRGVDDTAVSIVAPGAGSFGDWSPFGGEPVFGLGDGSYRMEARPAVQKLTSFRLTVEDVLTSATAGFAMSGIVLEAAVKRGMSPKPAWGTMT